MTRKTIWTETEGGAAIPAGDSEEELITWAKDFETRDRAVRKDEINGYLVSTVFLGVNHAWHDGPPLVYETMIFSIPQEGAADFPGAEDFQMRYRTREAAELGHRAVVEAMKAGASIEALQHLELEP